MKLIIDIDEDIYKSMKNTKYIGNEKGLVETIANGIPLEDIKAEMKKNCLRSKEYIHFISRWDDYLNFLERRIGDVS